MEITSFQFIGNTSCVVAFLDLSLGIFFFFFYCVIIGRNWSLLKDFQVFYNIHTCNQEFKGFLYLYAMASFYYFTVKLPDYANLILI